MSILHVYRTFKGEWGDATSETHKYLVETDDKTTQARDARVAVDPITELAIPAENSLLEGTSWRAKVQAERADQNPYVFLVTVVYSAPDPTLGFQQEPKPEGGGIWNKSISGHSVIWEEQQWYDLDGKEVRNSANDGLTNGVLVQIFSEEFIVSFNSTNFDLDAAAALLGYANEEPVNLTVKGRTRTFDEYTLRFTLLDWDFDFTQASSPDTPDLKVQLTFSYRADGWLTRKLDEGYRELKDVSGELKPVPMLDGNGDPTSVPMLLDGNGEQLAPGEDSVLLEFRVVKEADFSGLLAGI